MKVKAKAGSTFIDKDAVLISNFFGKHFSDGFIRPERIVELATPKNSPIHKFFTWEDSEAATKWRLREAQSMIQCLVVDIDGNETRKYTQPVVVKDYDERQYTEINKAMKTKDIWEQVLCVALRDAISWRNRYRHLRELGPIVKSIEETEVELQKRGIDL